MRFFFRRQRANTDHKGTGVQEEAVKHRWSRGRITLWGGALLISLIVGLGCWVVVGALQAKSDLERARDTAQQAKDAVLQGDTAESSSLANEAAVHAQSAHDATHSVAWDLVSALPWVGSPFESGQQITDVVLNMVTDILRPAADIGVAISPERLYKGGRVDVNLLRSQESGLNDLSASAAQINEQAQAITDPRYVSVLSNARSELQGQISGITGIIENAALAARLAPSLMGADEPRTYFMAFQTNAEARGTGGLLGGYGLLSFENGAPTVSSLASNTDLSDAVGPIDLGAEYERQYGYMEPFADFRNSNLSPHFPYAAQIWKTMWAEQTGMNVDGVIAIDPVALSYILGAVGPITMPDGEVVSADNVVQLTESTAYLRFPTDQIARKQYLQSIANAVATKIAGPIDSPRDLLSALGRATGEHRIALWSASEHDQRTIEETPLAHIVPDDAAPYAGVVVNNLGGNKLDYYLRSKVEYTAEACVGDTRASTVNVTMTNATPNEPLPEYVAAAAGVSPDLLIEVPFGTNLSSVRLFATKDAQLAKVLLNGQDVPAIVNTERGRPVFEVQVVLPPGQTADISFELSEPTSPGAPRVPSQPLLESVVPKVTVPVCER